MGKKDTVKAAKSHVKRDTRDTAKTSERTQGSIGEAYVRHHTSKTDADSIAISGDD